MKLEYTLLVVSAFLLLSCRQNTSKESFGSKESIQKAAVKVETTKPSIHPGKKVYDQYCKVCHQTGGQGVSGVFPPLTPNGYVSDKGKFIDIILNGMKGEIEINGERYNGLMVSHRQLTDQQIADVISYVRSGFGNKLEPVSPQEVEAAR
jgi:mono/diheme cytochrome c family protein